MQFHNLAAHVEPDACSSGRRTSLIVMVFQAEEFVEDPRTKPVWMPGPVSVTLIDTVSSCAARFSRREMTFDCDAPSTRCVLERIRQNVVEDGT